MQTHLPGLQKMFSGKTEQLLVVQNELLLSAALLRWF